MSDLGPFVAAALRDRVVQELLEENKQLRRERNEKSMIRVTGRSGTPVYYEDLVTNGANFNEAQGRSCWVLVLPTRKNAGGSEIGVSQETFRNDLEIRLGRVVLRKNGLESNGAERCECEWNGNEFSCYIVCGPVLMIYGESKNRQVHELLDPETALDSEDIIIRGVVFRKYYMGNANSMIRLQI